jgi:pyrimidine-nucleoside phosphorylase/thymidine phosphorylase
VTLSARSIIEKKRDAQPLSPQEIRFFIRQFVGGEIRDYQASALLMAICTRGMNQDETFALTREMRDSGSTLDLSGIPGKKVDKHSTGGVGDKTSLLLAPIVAVCGVTVPMITGRALGHTGGTLDKLQSIPGFKPELPAKRMTSLLARHGAVLTGQTEELAPADRLLYMLRDATGTVESIPLITASILSKKLAEDIDGLVLDVKTGSGAILQATRLSTKLARSLTATCRRFRTRSVAMLTRMDEPLGRAVGNALEIRECLDFLSGNTEKTLADVTYALAAQMLLLGGRARTERAAENMVREAVLTGAAMQRFREIVAAQRGDLRALDNPKLLAKARHVARLKAPHSGFLVRADARMIGMGCNALGAGRSRMTDVIDPAVGVYLHKKVGDRVVRGEVLCDIHWNDSQRVRAAMRLFKVAFEIAATPVEPRPMVYTIIRN